MVVGIYQGHNFLVTNFKWILSKIFFQVMYLCWKNKHWQIKVTLKTSEHRFHTALYILLGNSLSLIWLRVLPIETKTRKLSSDLDFKFLNFDGAQKYLAGGDFNLKKSSIDWSLICIYLHVTLVHNLYAWGTLNLKLCLEFVPKLFHFFYHSVYL